MVCGAHRFLSYIPIGRVKDIEFDLQAPMAADSAKSLRWIARLKCERTQWLPRSEMIMFLHKPYICFKHSSLSLLSIHRSSIILFCIWLWRSVFARPPSQTCVSKIMSSLVFNCWRSINHISFLSLVSSSGDKSTRVFADAACLVGSLPIRWASSLLLASRTVNFPHREETGREGGSHAVAIWSGTNRLLSWHLQRQMLQHHFTLSMCSVLA